LTQKKKNKYIGISFALRLTMINHTRQTSEQLSLISQVWQMLIYISK